MTNQKVFFYNGKIATEGFDPTQREKSAGMRYKKILTKYDCERLQRIIENCDSGVTLDIIGVETIKQYLSRSKQVEAKRIRPNIVTMNSRFLLRDIGNGRKAEYSLVFPQDSDLKKNRISVFSGIGSQVLGSSVGTVIKGGNSTNQYLLIEEIVYQPEAAGDYNL